MASTKDFEPIFQRLKGILQPFAERLSVTADTAEGYSLDTPFASEKYQKLLFFGAAQVKKNYVSFYLMPVYVYPDLLKDISPELRKRMQGKSCFNFSKVDDGLLAELETLTQRGFERYLADELVR
jgi:hypothetical protein